jgi:hypothetical protein
MRHPLGRALLLLSALLILALSAAVPAGAQPFGTWVVFAGNPTHGYLEVPHHPALNPAGGFTFEAWVAVSNTTSGEDCRSIAGKNYLQAWWIGQCNASGQPTLRSYLKGGGSARNGGLVPRGQWTHIAITFDGAHRRHYINGELAGEWAEAGPLPANSSPLRVGSDVSWQFTPAGAIDEVRLWSVARTQAELRYALNRRITGPEPGLVALWSMEGLNDPVGGHNAAIGGSGTGFLTFPVAPGCTSTATSLCLGGRFAVSVEWRNGAGVVSDALRVPGVGTPASGLFYFFDPLNWELLAKMANGCGINSRYWVFVSGSTELFYRLEIADVVRGAQRIYFSYPGPNPPAITDTDAFATCP